VNRKLLFIVCFVFAIGFVSSVSAVGDFAYIVKTNNGVDSFLTNEISALGYTYDIVE